MAIGDILASIFQEKESYAAYFMSLEGITRLDVLNYVSHGITKIPFKEEPEELERVDKQTKKKKPLN